MALEECALCCGRGKLQCSMCAGLGYGVDMHSAERLSCSCSGGYVDCLGCQGTGKRSMTTVSAGSFSEQAADVGDSVDSKEPASLAELQARYDEAVREARQKQKEFLSQIEQSQQDRRTRLDCSCYCEFKDWVKGLDVEAREITEELNEALANLKLMGENKLASDITLLESICSRIGTYRWLITQKTDRFNRLTDLLTSKRILYEISEPKRQAARMVLWRQERWRNPTARAIAKLEDVVWMREGLLRWLWCVSRRSDNTFARAAVGCLSRLGANGLAPGIDESRH